MNDCLGAGACRKSVAEDVGTGPYLTPSCFRRFVVRCSACAETVLKAGGCCVCCGLDAEPSYRQVRLVGVGCTQLDLFVGLELCLPAFSWILSPTATGCQVCLFQVPLERPAALAQADAKLSSQTSALPYVVAHCIFGHDKSAQKMCVTLRGASLAGDEVLGILRSIPEVV